jgi:hypothetical protein
MPDVIIPGPAGRLEGRYRPGRYENSAIAMILHPHPNGGGHMNSQLTLALYDVFKARGFGVLRFNFRGVGRSQGTWDQGLGELSDAATALDWLQAINPNAPISWVAGHSFGAYIAMQLLMRRPEIDGFVSVAPPTNMYDFSFLAPCPSSGIIISGEADTIVPHDDVARVVPRIRVQKGRVITHESIKGAGHFFTGKVDPLLKKIKTYLDSRLPPAYGGFAEPEDDEPAGEYDESALSDDEEDTDD